MKRKIIRNITIISAIFIITFSIMLITNYFQVLETTPLQSEILETLKTLNFENTDNTELQEHIRTLDLMARKAYFIRHDRLKTGIIILVVMVIVFVISVQFYFSKEKNIPEKVIEPIDDWALKSLSRKYIIGICSGFGVIALIFAFFTSPHLKIQSTDIDIHTEQIEDSYSNNLNVSDSEDNKNQDSNFFIMFSSNLSS